MLPLLIPIPLSWTKMELSTGPSTNTKKGLQNSSLDDKGRLSPRSASTQGTERSSASLIQLPMSIAGTPSSQFQGAAGAFA